jgi:plasmid replication initiation protein
MSNKKKLPVVKSPRHEMVVQGNDLIRSARFKLTALEQNIIYFCISKLKPEDKDFMSQTFTVTEFCEVCGISPDEGGNQGGHEYRRIKDAVKSVSDKSKWVDVQPGRSRLVRWIDMADVDEGSGTIKVTFSQSIKPYLVDLTERAKMEGEGYTQAHLLTFLALQSKYSKRLYEILKSYLYSAGTLEKIYRVQLLDYEIDELKRLLNAENYERYPDFRRKVLDVAEREINDLSDISITYTPFKTGKKVTMVQFSCRHKKAIDRLEAYRKAERLLEKR